MEDLLSPETGWASQNTDSRFMKMADACPGFIWMLDEKGRSIFYNRAFLYFLGLDEGADISDWTTIIYPEDLDTVSNIIRSALTGRSTFTMECRLKRYDGEWRWIIAIGEPHLHEDGTFLGFTGSSMDITDHKLTEDALHKSREQLKLLTDAMPVLISYIDNQEKYQFNNKGYQQWFHQPVEHYNGRSLVEVLGEKAYHVIKPYIEKVLGGEAVNYETTIPYRDGGDRFVLASYVPHIDPKGGVLGFFALVNDITERKKAEDALRTSEERYQNFIRQSSEGIWRFELSEPIPVELPPNEQIDFCFAHAYLAECNDAMARMYGYERAEEMAGKKLADFLPRDEDTEMYLTYFITSGYRAEGAESKEIDRYGQTKYFINNLVGIVENGMLMRAWGTQRDITAQKEAEAKIVDSESKYRALAENLEKLVAERTRELANINKELSNSNESLQQFAHVASHDLKEPVRKVRTFGSRLKTELGDQLGEKAKFYLEKIEAATDRMYQMIDGVLLYSSMNAVENTDERVNLSEVMENIITDLEVPIAQKNAEVSCDDLPEIHGSAILLYQLFYNLVNNSLKFSHPEVKPVITVKGDKILPGEIAKYKLDNTKPYIKILIRDNGIGFSNEYAESIFKTFTRLHSKDEYEGTGLGLALCRKIVERHGGAIRAEGRQGEGATFEIILPR